jgi:hypothetical protein
MENVMNVELRDPIIYFRGRRNLMKDHVTMRFENHLSAALPQSLVYLTFWGLFHTSFYYRGYLGIVVSWRVCHCHSLSPESNIFSNICKLLPPKSNIFLVRLKLTQV